MINCQQCGVTIDAGSRHTRYCQTCRRERTQVMRRQWMRSYEGRLAIVPKERTCRCGRTFLSNTIQSRERYCATCQEVYHAGQRTKRRPLHLAAKIELDDGVDVDAISLAIIDSCRRAKAIVSAQLAEEENMARHRDVSPLGLLPSRAAF